ncbi:FG-GAP repeat protein [Haloferula sp.]|uniref:FG-GAP repeat protein n=1 Tax=Haloferula sp. TaxID=2497595 RepID=UPI003C795599
MQPFLKSARIIAALSTLTLTGNVAFGVPTSADQAFVDIPAGLTAPDWRGIRQAYEAGKYAVAKHADGTISARNPGQQWKTTFDGRGFTVCPDSGGWKWGLELLGFGEFADVRLEGGKLSYLRGDGLTEWFVNDTRGLEQGWTLEKRPNGIDPGQPLMLQLRVRGGLNPRIVDGGSSMMFVNESGATSLTYGGLKAWDADGAIIQAHFVDSESGSSGFRILVDDLGARYPITIDPIAQQAYLKASNTGGGDGFGSAVAMSGDTVVVGAPFEASNAIGVDGDEGSNSAGNSGAVYVFIRSEGIWTQQAYLKASNTGAGDNFGSSVAVSGNTVVVGAPFEASNATGIDGDEANNSAFFSGAAYVFIRSEGIWTQQAYLKASNTESFDLFGNSVAVSGDTVVIGAPFEASNATGIDGSQGDNSAGNSGAAYVFSRSVGIWTQQAYLKASNTGADDKFGSSVSVSGDAVVVGAWGEASNATGVDGNQGDNSAQNSGAAYVFSRSVGIWTQQAYLKASNTGAADKFGSSVAMSGDTVVAGAPSEASNATGVDGNQGDDSSSDSGAAYAFIRSGAAWSQQAYLKASNTGVSDKFGSSVALSGETVVIGAPSEASNATGVDGNQGDNSSSDSGAAYVFIRSESVWTQQAYLKASNTGGADRFGRAVAVAGDYVVVGAPSEASNATGVGGDQEDNSIQGSGAAYGFSTVADSEARIVEIRYLGMTVELELEALDSSSTYKIFRDTTLPLGGSKVQVGSEITGETSATVIDSNPPVGRAFYQAEKE